MSPSHKIKAIDVIRDIRAGMGGSEIMDKYGLSSEQLQTVLAQLLDQRQIITTQIVEDIKAGLTDDDLMERYSLSPEGLRITFAKLVKRKFMTQEEIDNRRSLYVKAPATKGDRRELSRRRPPLSVSVHDDEDPGNYGTVLDITRKGLGLRGISAEPGQTKRLTVLGDEFGEVDPFQFEGVCRWVREDRNNGRRLAGFEITGISPESLARLLKWLRVCTLGLDD